ncbi:hypothetical protein EDD17DRAFT_1504955 [Pisolithus thermaeus]|nr:hypothetical protein EDD17DRAFT_1504955 [Pisolithus thermaeus]
MRVPLLSSILAALVTVAVGSVANPDTDALRNVERQTPVQYPPSAAVVSAHKPQTMCPKLGRAHRALQLVVHVSLIILACAAAKPVFQTEQAMEVERASTEEVGGVNPFCAGQCSDDGWGVVIDSA